MRHPSIKKVQARSLVDFVTEQLEAAIIGGNLAPGDRLSEHSLAEALGVSRGPLREAIRRLEGRKLVERTPNIGVRVAALSGTELLDLLYVREALEGMAAGLAATRMTDEEIEGLEELLRLHKAQIEADSTAGYYLESVDFDFHAAIARGSRNGRLTSMICGDLYDLLRVYRYRFSRVGGRAEKAWEEHESILDALKQRRSQLAEKRMRAHIRNARMHIESLPPERAATPITPRRNARSGA